MLSINARESRERVARWTISEEDLSRLLCWLEPPEKNVSSITSLIRCRHRLSPQYGYSGRQRGSAVVTRQHAIELFVALMDALTFPQPSNTESNRPQPSNLSLYKKITIVRRPLIVSLMLIGKDSIFIFFMCHPINVV